jgi:hypothetical protein
MNLRDLNSLNQLYLNTQTMFTTLRSNWYVIFMDQPLKNETIVPVNINRDRPVIIYVNLHKLKVKYMNWGSVRVVQPVGGVEV